ncbi:MAG: SpoIIE family protein phosphatase [Myxococcales bacterium]
MISAIGRARAYPGEPRSGDAVLIEEVQGRVLLALVDALGHGPVAASAADLAVATIREHRNERPARILQACHERLLRGRGAAISVITFDASGHGVFAGVGNVSARVYPESRHNPVLLPGSGVIGYRHRTLREVEFRLAGDSVGLLYSDGISSRVDPIDRSRLTLAEASKQLLADFGKPTDDASLILFAHRGSPRFAPEHEAAVR